MKKEQTPMNKMGTMPMTRLILTMSLPAIFSMTILAMYNVVDSIFISRYDMDGFTAVAADFRFGGNGGRRELAGVAQAGRGKL